MEQDILKRMEVLEARVAKLEEALGTGEATGKETKAKLENEQNHE